MIGLNLGGSNLNYNTLLCSGDAHVTNISIRYMSSRSATKNAIKVISMKCSNSETFSVGDAISTTLLAGSEKSEGLKRLHVTTYLVQNQDYNFYNMTTYQPSGGISLSYSHNTSLTPMKDYRLECPTRMIGLKVGFQSTSVFRDIRLLCA